MRAFASETRRSLQRARVERKRQRAKDPHRIHYFHEAADPYSHLTAQALAPLLERFDIELTPHLVGAPPAIAIPEPDMHRNYSRQDAAQIAPFYKMTLNDHGKNPDVKAIRMAERLLANRSDADFVQLAPRIGEALWRNDRAAMEKIAAQHGLASEDAAAQAIAKGDSLRAKWRHYLGAMFYYGGEWYWGIDRLPYLEERLKGLGARKKAAPESPAAPRARNAPDAMPGAPIAKLEFFLSLRSPYSYLSVAHILELPKRYPIEIAARPVLPMVMRGMKVHPAKGLYIFSDCKREAERLGIPFGKILDPVGKPVFRGYSLFPWANEKGRGGEYLASHLKASFAEGIDAYSLRGLRYVVERAGLLWDEAKPLIDNQDWQKELEQNRQTMFQAGCWGVPSFRLTGPDDAPPFAIWGRDRLWLIEEEIAKRAARHSPRQD